jgi:hypothetical protein
MRLPDMSNLLAIFGPADSDAELVAAIAVYRPDCVTVLIEDDDPNRLNEESDAGIALRDRLAGLMAEIEISSGAQVVGIAGDRSQLEGWRFDRELTPHLSIQAVAA